ncbi:type 2 isopentenyl-diphosphate Delta-isomerase [Nocardia brasiliensis]|uniref:type 2 isopentenyl-diphosphate Delta-isomerase n=1 Tax=Nocardia brasiliensis TaxID=37326 RepID=UPI00245439C0|nr:type 2 isopentenyl-diphosphate Delta-isomerase [Nocardia brasiliensis]
MTRPNGIGRRKDEQLKLAVDQQGLEMDSNDFDSVAFVHHALASIDRTDIDLTTHIAGCRWTSPLYINGMTGGSARTGAINRELAIAAADTGLPIASGSMSAYLRDPSVANTYSVLREYNPHGFLMANVNANATADQARRAVDLLAADALQIHLNAVQEIVMVEGDRDFSHWQSQIEAITATVGVPVIVKEVGFGLSRHTVMLLRDLGVSVADVGGRGGTDFARIENMRRRTGADFSFIQGWGQSTPCCLLGAADVAGIEVVASGGIRSPLDVARALALGARATGVAGRFLAILLEEGTEALITTIRQWLDQLISIMTILGARNPSGLTGCDLLFYGSVKTYCHAFGIDAPAYAYRSL